MSGRIYEKSGPDTYTLAGECINGRFIRATHVETVSRPALTTTAVRGCRRCGRTPCTCPPEAPDTLGQVLALQVQQGTRPAAGILAPPTTRRAPVSVCRTCRAVTCRCGVPAAPDTLGLAVQRKRDFGIQ